MIAGSLQHKLFLPRPLESMHYSAPVRIGLKLLEVHNLTKRFGGVTALRNLTFEVSEGSIFALIGPNGAGKTTTFNVIAGYYRPDAGFVRLRGESITGHSPDAICHRGVCRTFQTLKPFRRMSVYENVLVGALFGLGKRRPSSGAHDMVLSVLGFVDMLQKKDVMAADLTLAEQRRLELARSLATEPTVLLLDEPIAGLTPAEITRYVSLLQSVRERGTTILLVEHVLKAVMDLAEFVVVLNNGEKLAEGRPSEVAANPEVVRAYMGERYAPD